MSERFPSHSGSEFALEKVSDSNYSKYHRTDFTGLARVEIFLGLTATIQHYRILPQEGVDIDLEPTVVATFRLPKPQRLRLEKVV